MPLDVHGETGVVLRHALVVFCEAFQSVILFSETVLTIDASFYYLFLPPSSLLPVMQDIPGSLPYQRDNAWHP